MAHVERIPLSCKDGCPLKTFSQPDCTNSIHIWGDVRCLQTFQKIVGTIEEKHGKIGCRINDQGDIELAIVGQGGKYTPVAWISHGDLLVKIKPPTTPQP